MELLWRMYLCIGGPIARAACVAVDGACRQQAIGQSVRGQGGKPHAQEHVDEQRRCHGERRHDDDDDDDDGQSRAICATIAIMVAEPVVARPWALSVVMKEQKIDQSDQMRCGSAPLTVCGCGSAPPLRWSWSSDICDEADEAADLKPLSVKQSARAAPMLQDIADMERARAGLARRGA
jgi:hypothetical protein